MIQKNLRTTLAPLALALAVTVTVNRQALLFVFERRAMIAHLLVVYGMTHSRRAQQDITHAVTSAAAVAMTRTARF
jgi:hypothetical protein